MPGIMSKIINALMGTNEKSREKGDSHQSPACLQEDKMQQAKNPAGLVRVFDGLFEKIRGKFELRKDNIVGPALGAAAIILLSIIALSQIKLVLVVGLLILIGAISKFTQNLFPFVTGFDLCLYLTVITGVKSGASTGIFVGVAASTLGAVLRGRFDVKNMILPAVGCIIAGYSLAFFSGASMFYTGMAATVIYAVSVSFMFWIVTQCASNTFTLFATTLLYNYWIFSAM